MKTIIIIMFCCWIIYKTGAAGRFLDLFKMEADAPPEPPKPETPNRKQLQADAAYILESRGLSTEYIKYMSNNILNEIIQEYYSSR